MEKALIFLVGLWGPLALGHASAVLTHQYTFDDQSYVDSVGTANGVPTGSGTYLEAPTFVTDTPDGAGYALSVGANQGTLKSGFTLDTSVISATSGSISLWALAADTGTNRWILNDGYNNGGVGLQIPNNANLLVRPVVSSTNSLSTAALTANVWTNIVFTWDNNYDGLGNNQATFYLNGDLISTFTYSTDVNPTAALFIGGLNSANASTNLAAQFKGYLDNIQIYSGVLNASEALYLYNNPGLAIVSVPEPQYAPVMGLFLGVLLVLRVRKARKRRAAAVRLAARATAWGSRPRPA